MSRVEYFRQWREKNRDRYRDYQRQWNAAHPTYNRDWQRIHRGKMIEDTDNKLLIAFLERQLAEARTSRVPEPAFVAYLESRIGRLKKDANQAQLAK